MRPVYRYLADAIIIAAAGVALAVLLTGPDPLTPGELPAHQPDVANGEQLFCAGGCLSCHAPPAGSGLDAALPSGGTALPSPVGTFYPPNITPDVATGIGGWSDAQFATALLRGASPEGKHYFPAFPYTSYRNMTVADARDLKAYLFSLPPVAHAVPPADVPVAGLARLLMGPWKWLAGGRAGVPPDPAKGAAWNRGAYLVQGPGHCGECHTPRNLFMVAKTESFLAGGPHPEGKGKVPSLRGLIARKRFKDVDDLTNALRFGEAFGYEDMSSGGMGKVQSNLGALPEEDVKAIAIFLAGLR